MIYTIIAVLQCYLLFCVCVFVCVYSPVPEEHKVEFIEKKDHAVVLNVLRRFKDSESVVFSALQVLIPLAEPGKTWCINVSVYLLSIIHFL